MLIQAQHSALMLIDVQEKLFPLVIDAPQIEKNCRWLLQIAEYLKIPIVTSEQYPKGLGHTVTGLGGFSAPDMTFAKTCFSGSADQTIAQKIHDMGLHQWILIGIEAHVCVLQTALGLRALGKEVFVVDECIGARNAHDKTLALARMQQHGVNIVSREMVVFEWLHQSGSAQFKHISEAFIK